MSNKSLLIFILFSSLFTLVMAQTATDLFISEYVDGSSNQKAIELFNGTGAAVDLTQYSLKKQANGNGAFGNELILSGSFANADCYVIAFNGSTGTSLSNQPYIDLAITSNVMNFNGNDCIALCKNGELLDVVGVIDQSTSWGHNVTLRRNSNVISPVQVWNPNEWTTYPVDTFDDLGLHSFSLPITPLIAVISPNGGESWQLGSTHEIQWAYANFTGLIRIELMNGVNSILITDLALDTNSYEWTIPTDLVLDTNYRMKITSLSDITLLDTSDNTFSLTAADASDDATSPGNMPILYGNVPNPFTGSTSIRFDTRSLQPVTLEVYNVKGQKVATVLNQELSKGYQSVSWFGKDNFGNKLPSGVYLYKMQSGSYSSTKKMILLK